MKLIENDYKKEKISRNKCLAIFNYNNILLLLLIINIIINNYLLNYLLIENKNIKRIINEILKFRNSFNYKNNTLKNTYFPYNDKELIGLNYPEINFDKIKSKLKSFNIIDSFIDLINQLEIKLIYLEKEINTTKITSFYTSRNYYLKERNIAYDESNITQFHEIVNWIIIHKSSQLKGIASDKYLSCKYTKLKLGIDICEHRIAVFNSFDELNYNELKKFGNIVLKVSNSCFKTVFISNDTNIFIFEEKMKKFKKLYEFDHGVVDLQPFHLYSKKRIIVEKQFDPLTDLYEFKIYIINNEIKFIYLEYYLNNEQEVYLIYDSNYNFIFKRKTIDVSPVNIASIFNKNILKKLKKYAIKLSEDFPNFVRVDLYIFHDKIYFSELTFASSKGLPFDKDEKYMKDSIENFTRIDDYY